MKRLVWDIVTIGIVSLIIVFAWNKLDAVNFDIGILEYWNIGILEYWNIGEYWRILEYWNIGFCCKSIPLDSDCCGSNW